MEAWRAVFPFDFVLMAGDNVYDGGTAEDYRLKFELPYKPFLDAKVKFYAALGNHDDPNQPRYELFNTGGERYYTFAKRIGLLGAGEARFFVLDTVYLDHQQLRWLDHELKRSDAAWKVAVFHHPIYTSGRYRTHAAELRRRLEPIFVRNGLDVAFSGPRTLLRANDAATGDHVFRDGRPRDRCARETSPPTREEDAAPLRSIATTTFCWPRSKEMSCSSRRSAGEGRPSTREFSGGTSSRRRFARPSLPRRDDPEGSALQSGWHEPSGSSTETTLKGLYH